MSWKGKKVLLGVILLGWLVAAGCSGQTTTKTESTNGQSTTATEANSQTQEQMNIRIAYNLQKEHAVGVFFETLADEIEKRTADTSIKITAQTFSDGQLYNDTQMSDAINQGGVEIGGINSGLVASKAAPLLASIDLPFLFESWEAESAAIDGQYGELIGQDFETLNIKLIGWAKYGTGDVYGNFPFKVPSDLENKKVRSVGKAMSEWLEDVGAAPVTMSSQEVFQAMERKMIDGYATGASSVIDRSFYEVTKYGIEMNLVHTSFAAGANLDWWISLPEDVQAAILEAGKIATEVSREKAFEDDQMYKDKMKEYGMELYKPTSEELNLWKDSAKGLYNSFLQSSDKAKQLIDAVEKANTEHPAN